MAGEPVVPFPAPPGPGYCEIPPRALGSEPRPVPAFPCPRLNLLRVTRCRGHCLCQCPIRRHYHRGHSSPCRWVTWRLRRRRWSLAIRVAIRVGWKRSLHCRQRFLPAYWVELRRSPDRADRQRPIPLLPRPLPERALPPPRPGGGGTTSAEPRSEPAAWPERPFPPTAFRSLDHRCWPEAAQPGCRACFHFCQVLHLMLRWTRRTRSVAEALGFVRKSPVAELPQLLRSRLTCDGGGATTAGAGSVSSGCGRRRHVGGAETGGATTSTVCVSGTRELAKSRCASRGAGAMMVGASGLAVAHFVSRDIRRRAERSPRSGLVNCAYGSGKPRARERRCWSSRFFGVRLADALTSGAGATGLIAGRQRAR